MRNRARPRSLTRPYLSLGKARPVFINVHEQKQGCIHKQAHQEWGLSVIFWPNILRFSAVAYTRLLSA